MALGGVIELILISIIRTIGRMPPNRCYRSGLVRIERTGEYSDTTGKLESSECTHLAPSLRDIC